MGKHDEARQIVKYLTDAHCIEMQALAQLRLAPRVAGSAILRRTFAEHTTETESHERLVRELLTGRDAKPSQPKDLAGVVGGWGMILFARLNSDSSGKLVAHAFSYEHMELAAYELLRRFAERAGDGEVAETAALIATQERGMAERLRDRWREAAEVSLREKNSPASAREIAKYLRDACALEAQSLQLLRGAIAIARTPALEEALREQESQALEHRRSLDGRLAELSSGPSRLQDGALRGGAVGLLGFFFAQPDTTVKIAGFAYALGAMKQAGYGLLAAVAHCAEDRLTADLAERFVVEQGTAGERLMGTWDAVVDTQLNGG
jgi:ferritin-like metal-binding protein YciE